jgi:hypothetical protein
MNILPVNVAPSSVAMRVMRPLALVTPPGERSSHLSRKTVMLYSRTQSSNTRSAIRGSNVHCVLSASLRAFVPCPWTFRKSACVSHGHADGSL